MMNKYRHIDYEKTIDTVVYDPDTGFFEWKKNKKIHYSPVVCRPTTSDGYLYLFMDNMVYLAHRVAYVYMTGEQPDEIDHINHIRTDNRWCNLRSVSKLENQKNRTIQKNNTSGVVGLVWNKKDSAWLVRIKANHKNIYIGHFKDKFEAICARKSAEFRYGFHPNHGRINSEEEKKLLELVK